MGSVGLTSGFVGGTSGFVGGTSGFVGGKTDGVHVPIDVQPNWVFVIGKNLLGIVYVDSASLTQLHLSNSIVLKPPAFSASSKCFVFFRVCNCFCFDVDVNLVVFTWLEYKRTARNVK